MYATSPSFPLNALRAFFHWLSTPPGYRSHLSSADAEYFALSDKEAKIAKAVADRPVPTLDQIRHVLQNMPCSTDIELRNWAIVALILLTSARDLASRRQAELIGRLAHRRETGTPKLAAIDHLIRTQQEDRPALE